jgi:hypothetical protein
MTAPVPPDLWQRIERMIEERVAAAYRSGQSRNLSLTDGGKIDIRGGRLIVRYPDASGADAALAFGDIVTEDTGTYMGTGFIAQAPGNVDMMEVRSDAAGGHPVLALRDGTQNAVLYTDRITGTGLSRPYLEQTFYRARYADWIGTTSTTFETLFRAQIAKQNPALYARAWTSNDTSGATGEVRVMVNGVQLGTTATTAFSVAEKAFGPVTVAGTFASTLTVEIQARVTSGTGAVRVEPSRLTGWHL